MTTRLATLLVLVERRFVFKTKGMHKTADGSHFLLYITGLEIGIYLLLELVNIPELLRASPASSACHGRTLFANHISYHHTFCLVQLVRPADTGMAA